MKILKRDEIIENRQEAVKNQFEKESAVHARNKSIWDSEVVQWGKVLVQT